MLQEAMDRYLKAIHDLQNFNSKEVVKFFEDNKDEKLKLTWQYVSTLSATKSHFSSISEHPEWFSGMLIWESYSKLIVTCFIISSTGCNKLVTTKEEYFRKCAQGRIRSYLRDAKTRTDKSQDRLCDSKGHFQCQGQYNKLNCEDRHWINPHDNAESRVLFSTWNLDHVIERVKILADLCIQIRCNNECDYLKYFDLLFSRKNLKLVHKNCHVIACHDIAGGTV